MIIKNIKGSQIKRENDPAYLIEIEFLNEENTSEFALLASEVDEELRCIMEEAIISSESIFDIAQYAYETIPEERKEFNSAKENAIEAYGPYRQGLYPGEMESSKYSRIIKFAQMIITCTDDSEKLDELNEEYGNRDIEEIEVQDPIYWADLYEPVIATIKENYYKDEEGNEDKEFIDKFEKFCQYARQKAENEKDLNKQVELAAFLDNTISDIEDQGKEVLYKAIEEFEKL